MIKMMSCGGCSLGDNRANAAEKRPRSNRSGGDLSKVGIGGSGVRFQRDVIADKQPRSICR